MIFRPKSEIQKFFLPKIRWSPKKKKKKGLRQNSEWFFGRNPKFKGFFCPKLGDLQKKKKKKGLHQNWGCYFVQFRKFRRLRGGCFPMGGAIFHFSHQIGLKSTKTMRFCILHKLMGGSSPPPPRPPLATLLALCTNENTHTKSKTKNEKKLRKVRFQTTQKTILQDSAKTISSYQCIIVFASKKN